MLMVVFGAGASYDSVPSRHPRQAPPGYKEPFRPPLANELFDDRELFTRILQRFRRAHAVIPWLRHPHDGEPVERVLERLQTEADEHVERHRQLAAVRYYLQCALAECVKKWASVARGVTNYKSLLDQIEHRRTQQEPVCLVTFNYDTMLEEALPTVDVDIRSIGSYVSSSRYKVIKLHGSVTWAREVEPEALGNVAGLGDDVLLTALIDQAADLRVTNRFHLVNQVPSVRIDPHRPAYPAIAIPLERKRSYECPEEHVKVLEECVPLVHKLVVIGWHATDAPFLDLLRKNGRQAVRVLVVAGDHARAEEVRTNLGRALDRAEFRTSEGGFTDLILNRELEDFLRA
jgi:hypothetical protein